MDPSQMVPTAGHELDVCGMANTVMRIAASIVGRPFGDSLKPGHDPTEETKQNDTGEHGSAKAKVEEDTGNQSGIKTSDLQSVHEPAASHKPVGTSSSSSGTSSSDDSDGYSSPEDEEACSHESQDDSTPTEEKIQELVDRLLEVEAEAREAQEALEEESLECVRKDVHEELAASLSGPELENEVAHEMRIFVREWKYKLSALESESAVLQDQLGDAGVALPELFKIVDKQAAEGSVTEAWRKRSHWVGSEASLDYVEAHKQAEKHLDISRPVMMRRGKLVEEGASGFLEKKISIEGVELADRWRLLDGLRDTKAAFNTREWAAVYYASTPQQAVRLGIKFPGADEVDEIADIDGDAEAIALEEESKHGLTDEQKRSLKRVREEDDLRRMIKKPVYQEKRRITPSVVHSQSKQDAFSGKRNSENPEASCSVIILSDDDDDQTKASNVDKSTSVSHIPVSVQGHPAYDNETVMVLDDATSPLKTTRKPSKVSHSKRKRIEFESGADNRGGGPGSSLDPESGNSVGTGSGQNASDLGTKASFQCTVCGKELMSSEVAEHALLRVIICKACKELYQGRIFAKDEHGQDRQCRWCGETGELLLCGSDSCGSAFCSRCIERNFGFDEGSAILKRSAWECFFCDPSQLELLRFLLARAKQQQRSAREMLLPRNVKRRKNIKKVIADELLSEQTKQNLALEKERRERLQKWYEAASKHSGKTKGRYNGTKASAMEEGGQEHLCEGDCGKLGCVINIAGRADDETLVRIPASISRVLKSYQLSGVRFMWENCIESVSKAKSGKSKALGCILAHCMGLGKTLQVITFLYTVMRVADLGFKTAMIVLPVNVLHNWSAEFEKWKPKEVKALPVFMLEDVARRINVLETWQGGGGVLLIGYAAFRLLSLGKYVKDKAIRDLVCEWLQNPGPDLLICDEAHTIKNPKADTTLALKSVRTRRRIALTGSPLQNNLLEYYCMVDFVREGFLGSSSDFRNRYQNPIENGQHKDSTTSDVVKMKRRAHVLHRELQGFVQRRDMSVLKHELPPKCVWVISVKLSQLQKNLYRKYLSICDRHESSLFDVFSSLSKIWNHPDLLWLAKEKDDQDSLPEEEDNGNEETAATKQKIQTDNWWREILESAGREVVEHSGKMQLALKLLSLSAAQGEKVLVFSQSLATLDLLEVFLRKLPLGSGDNWAAWRNWFRIDGKTKALNRQMIVERFNDASNTGVKCVLISTRAGSLGINLVGATRVIIMDGSWNPTHDLQALFRAWRIGQTKPVHVYRLLAYGTMEEKIYNRQLAKESVSARVLDEHQVGRHLKADDLDILYTLDDEEEDIEHEIRESQSAKKTKQQTTFCTPSDAPPRDELLALLLLEFRPQWIVKYHEHEPLLENLEDEELTAEEKTLAWEEVWRGHEEHVSSQAVAAAADQQPQPQQQHHVVLEQVPKDMPGTSVAAKA